MSKVIEYRQILSIVGLISHTNPWFIVPNKNLYLFSILALVFYCPSFGQSMTTMIDYLRTPLAFAAPEDIVKVSVYEEFVPSKDSIVFDSALNVTSKPAYIEYYGIPGKVTISESFDRHGELQSRYLFGYSDDKMVEMIGDSCCNNAILRMTDDYGNDHLLERTTIDYFGDTSKLYIVYDDQERAISEFQYNKNGIDTGFQIFYFYNESDQIIAKSFYSSGVKLRQSFSVYNSSGRHISTMSYDAEGKLINEQNSVLIDPNETRRVQQDHHKNVERHFREVQFKDERGNVVKTYYLSGYSPDKWSITTYLIQYRKELHK